MARVARTASIVITVLLATLLPGEAGRKPWVENDRLEFRLPDLNGQLVSLTDTRFAGKVVLVNLWATWCPPCLSEIPTLVELQAQFGDRGLAIVAIAFEAEEQPVERRERMREFIAKRGIEYLVLDGGLPEDFEVAMPSVRNVRGFPVEFLVDHTGRVVTARNSHGYKKSWAKKLTRDIESLLDARPE